MVVNECKPDVGGFSDCGVVFSGLDHDVAGDIGGYHWARAEMSTTLVVAVELR